MLLPVCGAFAVPFVEHPGNFTPQVTFSEVPSFTPVNGLSINGFTFTENIPNLFTASSAAGPNPANNLSGDRAVSGLGLPSGYMLTVSLANPALSFGFGFALQSLSGAANAVTLTLFSGATNLGSLSFAANPDPNFAGGFAGVGNDTFFDRVQITFNTPATGFAVDNFSARAAVPETGSTLFMLLATAGALGLFASVRRRSA